MILITNGVKRNSVASTPVMLRELQEHILQAKAVHTKLLAIRVGQFLKNFLLTPNIKCSRRLK